MPARHSRESAVRPDLRLDRKAFAQRLAAAIAADRATVRGLAARIGVPAKQLLQVQRRDRVMDWAYHAVTLWCAEVEAQHAKLTRAERQRELARERRALATP
ncbi:MAG: hypothetical protein WA210_09050 [Burkholderiaceae bacterium]